MKALGALVLAVALGWIGYSRYFAPIGHPPGVLIRAKPMQIELPAGTPSMAHGSFQLRPLARFSLIGRILHRKNYRYGRGAKLVPTDLAIGWGVMSDQAVLDQVEISQSNRFYFYEYRNPPPIPQDEIARHSSNMHIIPADAEIRSICRSLRAGELVELEGELVEATGPEIGKWTSSLRRDDTGNGACELFFVRKISKLEPAEAAARQVAPVALR